MKPYHAVNIWLGGFKHDVNLPVATTRPCDHQLQSSAEGSPRGKAEQQSERPFGIWIPSWVPFLNLRQGHKAIQVAMLPCTTEQQLFRLMGYPSSNELLAVQAY